MPLRPPLVARDSPDDDREVEGEAAPDVYRKGGKVYSKYLGIREAPAGVDVEEHSPKKAR